ncbi:MAG: tripartite tricarboxylate transporter substrate binding protein [Acetobacteraceae bacterium]|nr:tripartite tricarboxylate transporter substrate binding protein [Acetobacteraceae bacterium]
MTVPSRRRLLLAAPALLLGRRAAAQAGPVRIIVPYTPGAFNDTLARLVADGMQGALGQVGVVENRPGASGSIGIAAAAQAAPDGTAIAVANTANLTMNPFLFANTGYDTVRDLSPICVVARLMNALTVSAESGITGLPDLIARSKARPGGLSFASSGAGSSPHLAAELLKHRTGIPGVHVPYRGSAPGIADLIGGRVDWTMDNLPNVLPQAQAGKLRILAVTGRERDPAAPDVPTLRESGLADFEVFVWFGFVGPAALPAALRDRLSAAILRIAQRPETAERIRSGGATVWPRDSAQFAALIRDDLEKWGTVIRAAGLKLE